MHAWAAYLVHELEKGRTGSGDQAWLENVFQKLTRNFTWWLNRKDVDGRNVFQGGFLGLDNIGVFDRSAPLPTGGHLDQADGTAWMALYCQNMLQIALDLAEQDPVYVEQAQTFLEHFAWILAAVNQPADGTAMWDEEDGFPQVLTGAADFIAGHPSVSAMVSPGQYGGARGHRLLSFLDENRLRRVLEHMLDENEFLSPYGIRALSRHHADHPFRMDVGGQQYEVNYLPAESDTGMFGGNSNWRGPIWFPVNALMIRALLNLHEHWGNLLTFSEYFHGDNRAGIGASHQTGWTGLAAVFPVLFPDLTGDELLHHGIAGAMRRRREEDKK